MAHAENRLIERLPRPDRLRLLALCEPVQLVLSDVLGESGSAARHVFFPVDGFISLVTQIDSHPGLEVGMVGREGLLGAQLALGVAIAPVRAVVQGAGSAWRVASAPFGRELARSAALREMLDRYLYVTMVQLATASACRRFHLIGPRLARWLLMSQDRAHCEHFHVTHEALACMLGVRRVGVTVAAGVLQHDGLIHYHRGEMSVVDRSGLEAAACSCYAQDSRVYAERMN